MNNLAAPAQDTGYLKASPAYNRGKSNKEIVKAFLEEVRSGRQPENTSLYMAERVLAHQLNAENETVVERTPQNYADHVREFLAMYGDFHFEISELLADGDKVYARWRQTGKHLASLHDHEPTGKPLVEIASATYRLEGGKIVEYWIQVDRYGMEEQLKRHAAGKR
ncbi:ester cyclase [Telluribacter sp. SYSU D00476]|uniref:ester cyclase n=1 Tax=Telluribacter sp. SYSU D00476 TaxID=2811430 RepID=UPI001FF638E9|nr:ester cyclase [Telluribacter sp. SYSU D00476]